MWSRICVEMNLISSLIQSTLCGEKLSSPLPLFFLFLLFGRNWQRCASPVPSLIYLVLGMIFLYYLNKVKSGPCRLSTACRNQWSVKLQHQTAGIIAQKGANVPVTFTEHFYNDWIKKEKSIDLCYSPFSPHFLLVCALAFSRHICLVWIHQCI